MAKPVITGVTAGWDNLFSRDYQRLTDVAGSLDVAGTAGAGLAIRISVDGVMAPGQDRAAFTSETGRWDSTALHAYRSSLVEPVGRLAPGLHALTASSFASGASTTPIETSDPVLVNIGTGGADTLQGLTLGRTVTGPGYVFGHAGNDRIVAYTVVDDASGHHATGGTIRIDGGFETYVRDRTGVTRETIVTYDGGTDTVVIPVSLSSGAAELVRPLYGLTGPADLLNASLTVATHDATIEMRGVEKLAFNDVTITVQSDPLVDFLYYGGRYHELAVADVNARQHYDATGWKEGRDPNAFFSTAGYLAANPDVAAGNTNPLTHYDTVGWKEGRDPSAAFDTSLYLRFNPDVAAAGLDPLMHYLTTGRADGRKASPVVDSDRIAAGGFDPTYYKLANPDVAAAGVDPLRHYQAFGWKEGRDPDAFFDPDHYLAANPDVAAAEIDPLLHYASHGWREGRDPSTHFDTGAYLAANADVAAAGINPLEHFLRYGIVEGRSAEGDLF